MTVFTFPPSLKKQCPFVGLTYSSFDKSLSKIQDIDRGHHESPKRIGAIIDYLEETGIFERCKIFYADQDAEDEFLLAVHSENHVSLMKEICSPEFDFLTEELPSELSSLCFNPAIEAASRSIFTAAGAAINMVEKVANGELDSAVAVVRPPGHYAERDKGHGYCLFNNVAVAATFLLERTRVSRILIVDWDVHHGSGTQKIFWNDSRVLVFSVHRHEGGRFFPPGDEGSHTKIGAGVGAGYNINVPWEKGGCSDADYFLVWDYILLPVAEEYSPDMIIISAGFDAAVGDPIGGCCVTPNGFAVLLEKLKKVARGRIVMVLEGGYNLDSTKQSLHACLEVLLEDQPAIGSSESDPHPLESTGPLIRAVRQELKKFWPSLAVKLPQDVFGQMAPPLETLTSSSDSMDPPNTENEVPLIKADTE